jgi:mono/diheme cytochrome c family protein
VSALAFFNVQYVSTPGQRIYEKHCTKCHGRSGKKGILGAKNLEKSRIGFKEAKAIIRNGKGLMPSWDEVLTQPEIDSVIMYVRTLRK